MQPNQRIQLVGYNVDIFLSNIFIMNQPNFIFDFDGTLISILKIDYEKMKQDIKEILNTDKNIKPMFDKIQELSPNEETTKRCFELIDKYELDALDHVKINDDVLELYLKSKYKIILSRNGRNVINTFFEKFNLHKPDFISCRDNCQSLKPNIAQIELITNKFHDLRRDNITIVGDSWHDEQLSKNYGCMFLKVTT